MKKAILGALVAGAVIAPVATAQAATTTTHCDTDSTTFYATKEGKRVLKVGVEARGCISHTAEDDGTVTCSRVTVMQAWRKPASYVKPLDKKVKTERHWGRGATFTNPLNGCFPVIDPLFEKEEEWGGRYRYKLGQGRTDWCAFPIVEVIVRGQLNGTGDEVQPEYIVTIRKARGWKFTKGMNSGSCKFRWKRRDRDNGNTGSGDNTGSTGNNGSDGSDGYGGITAGTAVIDTGGLPIAGRGGR